VIDPSLLRDNPQPLVASLAARGAESSLVDRAMATDDRRRQAIAQFEALRAEQNALGKAVAQASGDEKASLVASAQELAQRVKDAQASLTEAEDEAKKALWALPNIVIDGVPAGGADNFRTMRTVGSQPKFSFPPLDHLEIAQRHGFIDMGRGAKVSGSRFYFLTGMGALLENALMQHGLHTAVAAGFTPIIPPTLVKPEVMAGTGFLGEHASEVYYLPSDELYLTGTAEVALAGFHADEIIDLSSGPLRYVGMSTCYRREAGSHGKDVTGIIRVHQFQKLEMFSYVAPEDAEAEHEKLLAWQEQMLNDVGLHYRVIDVAAGDLGSSAARKYDIEAWIPSQATFRELTSTSNCTTYQARRLNVRHRPEADGPTQTVATLNGTLATTRWIVALLETHQQEDGTVTIPDVLRPYLGGHEYMGSVG